MKNADSLVAKGKFYSWFHLWKGIDTNKLLRIYIEDIIF